MKNERIWSGDQDDSQRNVQPSINQIASGSASFKASTKPWEQEAKYSGSHDLGSISMNKSPLYKWETVPYNSVRIKEMKEKKKRKDIFVYE